MHPPKSRTFVPPHGAPDSPCVIVLSAPDRVDLGQRSYLSGKDGRDYIDVIQNIGIYGSDCYITAVIKDGDENPNTHVYNTKKAGVVTSVRYKEYLAFLQYELSRSRPKVILAVGNIALYALTGKYGIHKWRGSILTCEFMPGVYVIPTFEPWNIRISHTNAFLIEQDAKKARDILRGIYTPTVRNYKIYPTFNEIVDFLTQCYVSGMKGTRISFDIEVNNYNDAAKEQGLTPQVTHISFAMGLDGVCIPFVVPAGDYFPADQELDIWKLIAKILEETNIEKVGQNLIFDSQFLFRTYGIRCNNMHDTMIAQQTLLPEFHKGLDMITSLWTDQPYYKDDGKEFLAGGSSHDNFNIYNALDSLICSEVIEKQVEQLKALNNYEAYDRQRKLIPVLTYMMERGVKVDVGGMHKEYVELGRRLEDMEAELESITWKGFNPRSTKDLHEYFYGKKHLKPYKKRNTKGEMAPCYDEIAMKRIIRKGFPEAKMIQEIKRLGKMRSVYLDIKKVDKDGRYRCAYSPSGTMFSRLSSRENIFGTGGNLQNWPKFLRKYLLIDKDYVGYSIDLSQAENRIVAYQGRIIPMIRAFENGDDVHALTARLIMDIILGKDIAEETEVRAPSFLGDGSHTWRDWGKKANHGFNYDWGYKAFAIKNEMPENDGKLVYESYHSIYPEVQGRFHRDVKDALRSTRTITNLLGRKTLFLGTLDDQLYREAYSCIPQGSVGDIINEYGLEYIYDNKIRLGKVELLTQTHDEIIFQIPLNDECTFLNHAHILRDILNNLEPELCTSHGIEFKIPTDLTMLTSLNSISHEKGGDGIEVPHYDYTDSIYDFANKLEESWRILNDKGKEVTGEAKA